MTHLNNRPAEPGAINQLIGAIADSFTRNRTLRLTRLEERLGQVNRWAISGIAVAFAYFAYQMWGELQVQLQSYDTEPITTHIPADSADDARSSIFIIFALALGGPVALLVCYLVLGFIYNTLHDALVQRVPLVRFFVVPALLISGLMFIESRHEAVKEGLLDLYAAAEQRVASAKSLRQQARAVGEQVQLLRQMEAQLIEQRESLLSSSESGDKTPSAMPEGEPISQEEAVRRLGETMLEWQGLSAQPSAQERVQGPAVLTPPQGADVVPAPTVKQTTQPNPAGPADI